MTAPKPPPLDVVRRWVDCAPPYPDLPLRNLARAYLALVEAARPFARCGGKLWPCPGCAGCRLAALMPEDDRE